MESDLRRPGGAIVVISLPTSDHRTADSHDTQTSDPPPSIQVTEQQGPRTPLRNVDLRPTITEQQILTTPSNPTTEQNPLFANFQL